MKTWIGRAASARVLEKRVRAQANNSPWLAASALALLCAMASNTIAQSTGGTTPGTPTTPTAPTTLTAPAAGTDASAPSAEAASAQSSEPSDPQTELMSVVEPKYEMDATSISAMGDDFSPTNGTITFSATDISIPGNFAIPVELRRWVPSEDADTGGPAGWKWNIPYIRGNYLDVMTGHTDTGWQWGNTDTWRYGKHCTGSADVVIDNQGELVAPNAYWQGKQLHIPGVTSETFLTTASGEQVTKSHFKIISSLCTEDANGQQNIVVKGPDGTTYTFGQIKTYYNGKTKLKDPIVRTRLLLITKIKDRFDNEVNYSYVDGNLSRILASDGREINITYQSGVATTASAHGRTWTYGANSVTLPDGRQWNYTGLSALAFNPDGIGGYEQMFQYGLDPSTGAGLETKIPGCGVAAGDYTATVSSPDGLLTTYTFRDTVHYRSKVEPDFYKDKYTTWNSQISRALYCTVARSLVSKVVSGAGVGPYTWNYTYSGNRGTYSTDDAEFNMVFNQLMSGPFDLAAPSVGGYPAPVAAGGAVNYRSVTINGPDKRSVFYIDRQFQSISEERVIAQDTLSADGTQLLERRESSFAQGAYVGMHWYMCPCDGLYPPVNEKQLNYHLNQTQEKRIRYVGNSADATFTTAYAGFDSYGRHATVTRSTSLGNSRTETVVYEDNPTLWVMGQIKSVSVGGISAPMVEHTYNTSKAQRTSTTKFGILQANYEYHPDGTLWKHIDGLNHATVYTDYKRGQPQRIDRANSTFETAVVNDWGQVDSRVDPNGYQWQYGYNTYSRRLETITPPPGWTPTGIVYARATGSAYGLPTGHWSQTVTKGNAKTVTYFDVLWRPLMVRSYDNSNEANTRKVVVKTFDVSGQPVFESYPKRDLTTVAITSPGQRMQYDALGRPTRLEADTSQGVSVTTTEYLTGLQTRVTNPRGKVTTQGLWALDDPDKAQLATIIAPEGVNVTISRNILGNPTSIRRWGTARGVSADVTRSYVYDSGQRLCKTLEPEVMASVQGYDAAGNIAWRAPGINLSGNNCELETSIPTAKKISYIYDTVNQLSTVTYGDGSPGVSRTYWNDGLLKTIDSNGANWAYGYNSLRKPSTETLTYAGKTYDFGWVYDGNGSLSGLTYPTAQGPAITYSPNALGEPSQVGSYASAIALHPNGAIAGFNFGNGMAHSQTQTVEGTPELNQDGTVLKDFYTYDANGNVATITDQRISPSDGSFSRTMGYDDLDRLASVSAPGVWNTATYLYDPVDNLRTATVGTRTSTLDYGINGATNRLDRVVTNGSTTNYLYDGNGNIQTKGGQTYTFDLGNRLASASLGGSYSYDGHGRRTKIQNLDGTSRIQVYSQGGQLLWSEANGSSTIAATVTYSCSTGTLVGQQCQTTSTYAATPGAYSCNAGDTLSGSTCTHTTSYTATASYSCPSGGTLSGTTCTRNDDYAATLAYSCNAGDSRSGTTCTHTTTYTATTSYSCPSGGTLSGTNCNRNDDYAATLAYSCNAGDSRSGSTCTHTSTYAASYSCPSGGSVSGSNCNRNDDYAATVSYSCNAGDTRSGTTCTHTNTYTATTSYSCPSGGTLSGTNCNRNDDYAATLAYSCNAGDTRNGTTCTQTSTYAASYSCPSGGSVNGSNCNRNDDYAATVSYSCNAGDSRSGTTCTQTSSTAATLSYSCPSGYTLSGSTCSKTTSVAATATYSCNGLGTPDAGGMCQGVEAFAYNYYEAYDQCQAQTDAYGLSLVSVNLISGKRYKCTVQANTTYSCPGGGTLSGAQCVTNSSQAATANYSCSSGTLVGQQCQSTSTYTATSNYSCPSGGTLSGSMCLKTTVYTATASCPSGGTLSGGTCTQTSTYTATSNYSCPSGGTLSGSTCLKPTVYAATPTNSCPSGGTLSGSTCTQTSTYTATSNYSCPSGGSLSGSMCLKTTVYTATASCPSGGTLSGGTCTQTSTYTATSSYSCPSGGTLSGSTCLKPTVYTATPTNSCPSGGTLSGSTCTQTSTYTATSNYSCPSGGTLSGTTCLKPTVYTSTAAYSCPSGGTLSGSTCTQTNTYAATQGGYSCMAGDSLSGTTCTHTSSTAATSSYSCPNGGTLSGNQCTGVSSSIKTAYIYLGGKQIAESVVGGVTQYVHTDALGSPVAHTDQSQAVLNRTKFEPYGYTAQGSKPGPTTSGQATTGSAIGFTGHVNDPETDLVYMQQRYYDPIGGRFLSVDPVTTDAATGKGFGRYHYAENNPYSFIDPDGRDPAGIAKAAKSHVGEGGWGAPGYRGGLGWITRFKCNLFVNRAITEAGDVPPLVNGRQAIAGELGDPNQKIEGWDVVTDGTIKDGDIVSIPNPSYAASGHTGIVVFVDGQPKTVSADSTTKEITHGQFGFREGDDKKRVIRRKTDEPKAPPPPPPPPKTPLPKTPLPL